MPPPPGSKDLTATPKSENLTQVAGGSCITARERTAKAAPAAPPQSRHRVCESLHRTESDGGVPCGAVTSDLRRANLEKVALSTNLRDDRAAALWPPHHSPRATRAALCRRAQSWGPSTKRGGFSLPSPQRPRARPPDARCLHRKGRLLLSLGGNRQTHADPKPAPHRPIGERSGVHCTLGSRKPPRASKSCGARGGAARLTCEARHERAEPEQTGVEGRGHPRHGARRSAGARGGDGAGPRPGDRSRMPGAALRLTAPAAGLARAPPPPSSSLPRLGLPELSLLGTHPRRVPARLLPAPLPFSFGRQPPLFSAFSSLLSRGPPLGQFTARRDGAGRAPGRTSSALRRDPPARLGPGLPRWLSQLTHLGSQVRSF